MPKTLIEKMENKNVPKSWVREVEALIREIEALNELVEEYGLIIDELAREREVA